MKFKKLLTTAVTSLIVMTSMTSVQAGEVSVITSSSAAVRVAAVPPQKNSVDENSVKISKDKAKEIAVKTLKNMFEIDIDDKKFETGIELRKDYELDQGYLWEISYTSNYSNKGVNNHVSVDANTGVVVRVDSYEYMYEEQQPKVASITESQAKSAAEEFIKKTNPEEFEQVKLLNNEEYYYGYKGYYPVNYNFRYVRVVNGIEFDRNFITIGVNGLTGKVSSYNYRWSENISIPTSEGAVSKDKALELYKEGAQVSLRYIPFRNQFEYDQKVKEVKLVYAPEFLNGYMLDAKEGKFINWNGTANETLAVKDVTAKEKDDLVKDAGTPVSLEKEIDNSRASKVINERLKALVGDSYEVDSLRYMENNDYWESNGKKAWSANFYKKVGDSEMRDEGGQITIDALTEEVISLYRHSFYPENMKEDFKPKLTWEEAYTKAITTIAKYYPNKLKDLKTEQKHIKNAYYVNDKNMGERYYSFYFPRMVNGIMYTDNSISVGFNAETGSVMEFRCMWNDDIKFPGLEGVITKDDAEEIFFERNKAELAYTIVNKSSDYTKPDMEVKLVYSLRPSEPGIMPPANIDAFTGKFLDYSGAEIVGKGNGFKDIIKGHWAEKELDILAYQGIIDTRTFMLDSEVTMLEAVKMLVNAKGYRPYMVRDVDLLKFTNITKDDSDYKYLQLAVKYGILENAEGEFKGDAKVTREEMAKLLVKLLQYQKLAGAREIFNLNFEDTSEISEENYGYVAIGKGLGIFEGSDGKFRPKDNMTLVEFVVAIYKALDSIRTVN